MCYVFLRVSEEMKKLYDVNVEDLNKKFLEVIQRYIEKKQEVERLLVENDKLIKNVSCLEVVFVVFEKYEKELMGLKFNIVELKK